MFRYVQHIIEKNGEQIWKLLAHKNASIYVAGNARNMPDEVEKTFISVYSKHGNMTKSCSEEFFRNMKMCRKYQTESW